jgi:hypothetical protein
VAVPVRVTCLTARAAAQVVAVATVSATSACPTAPAVGTEVHSAVVARAAGMRGPVNRAVHRASEAHAVVVRVAVAVVVAVGEGDSTCES